MTQKEDLFERARTFQDSFEAGYNADHPTVDGTLHSNYRRELQVVLSQYYEEVLGFNCDATATLISSEHRASSTCTEQRRWSLR